MKQIKLFEQYNRDETLLGLAKMGLRTDRKEVFDLAVKRGFNIRENFPDLFFYCTETIDNYNSLEWIYKLKKEYQSYINGITELNCTSRDITDLTKISRLINLEKLYCQDNKLTSLKGIEGLTRLIYLKCGKNNLTDLKGIEGLTQLTYLECEHNNLISLEGIKSLIQLSILNCGNNKITDLKPLEYSMYLTTLYCHKNKITTLKHIENSTLIDDLYCKNNPLPQEVLDINNENNHNIESIRNYYKNNA